MISTIILLFMKHNEWEQKQEETAHAGAVSLLLAPATHFFLSIDPVDQLPFQVGAQYTCFTDL